MPRGTTTAASPSSPLVQGHGDRRPLPRGSEVARAIRRTSLACRPDGSRLSARFRPAYGDRRPAPRWSSSERSERSVETPRVAPKWSRLSARFGPALRRPPPAPRWSSSERSERSAETPRGAPKWSRLSARLRPAVRRPATAHHGGRAASAASDQSRPPRGVPEVVSTIRSLRGRRTATAASAPAAPRWSSSERSERSVETTPAAPEVVSTIRSLRSLLDPTGLDYPLAFAGRPAGRERSAETPRCAPKWSRLSAASLLPTSGGRCPRARPASDGRSAPGHAGVVSTSARPVGVVWAIRLLRPSPGDARSR